MRLVQPLPHHDGFRARTRVSSTQMQASGPLRRGPDAELRVKADAAEFRRVQEALDRVARETRVLLRERSR